jgi:hypothetical protein
MEVMLQHTVIASQHLLVNSPPPWLNGFGALGELFLSHTRAAERLNNQGKSQFLANAPGILKKDGKRALTNVARANKTNGDWLNHRI